jgi:hypothetical protein
VREEDGVKGRQRRQRTENSRVPDFARCDNRTVGYLRIARGSEADCDPDMQAGPSRGLKYEGKASDSTIMCAAGRSKEEGNIDWKSDLIQE